MKAGLICLVRLTAFFSSSIVVHEGKFKEILVRQYGCKFNRIRVIPHGIEEVGSLIEKDRAKEKLGLNGKNVISFFGYITGYKNVELLIESAELLKTPNWCMVIAGGPHPRLRDNSRYCEYFSEFSKRARAKIKDRILFKGFIPEEDIPTFFSATDLMIFPYKVVISSSGPMCLAVSFKTPFLVSEEFNHIVEVQELIFRLDPRGLARSIDAFFQKHSVRREGLKYIQQLAVQRSWQNIAKKTIDLYRKSFAEISRVD